MNSFYTPLIHKFMPITMNIELTTVCPLCCPQCYCSLTGGNNINLETAVYWIQEGGTQGVKTVMLSGGETLCYPYIYEVVEAAHKYCGNVHIAMSGFGFTKNVLEKLIESGVGGIFISINGSTEEINAHTRDGYDLAISALQILKECGFQKVYINWVMHNNNAYDFINVVKLSEKYNVKNLVVIALKPDSNNMLLTLPTTKHMLDVQRVIHNYNGNVRISVESCYSPMRALIEDTKLFGNLNIEPVKGCAAGRYTFSVNVDGYLSPCRHLEHFETYSRLEDYWNESKVLHHLREIETHKEEPCVHCYFSKYCRHCLAINDKMKGELYIGHELCPLQTFGKYKDVL